VSQPEAPTVEAEAPPVEPAPIIDPDAADVKARLDAARAALDDNQLIYPTGDNALDHYRAVLAISEDHPDAVLGLETIVERFLERARRAIERQQWASARSMLARARLVDRTHPGIGPIRTQVDLLANAQRFKLNLTVEEVRRRSASAAQKLAAFGHRARSDGAFVTIRAASDAEGRWMYEQLNRAEGESRIRGGIEIGRPPKVEIVILPAAPPT
jgi:hypothetical protein